LANDSVLLESIRSLLARDAIAPSERLVEYTVDGLTPQVAVSPSTPEEVAAVLAAAAQQEAAVIPWGGGTSMAIGNAPRRYDVALDITRLNQVVAHEPADLTVVVQGGARLQDLQDYLAGSGQYLPLDPPLPQSATIGGVLASNAGGPWRHAYGWPRDWALGLKVALADGSVTRAGGRVVKNVAGYDMTKLYLGSFGTLGVIVEAAFKVIPLPEASATGVAFFKSAGAAAEAALAIDKRNLSLRSLTVVGPGGDDLFAADGVEPPPSAWALLVAASGVAAAVERSLAEAETVCGEQDGIAWQRLPDDAGPALWEGVRRLLLPTNEDDRLLTRAGLLPSQVAAFLESLESLARKHGLAVHAASHVALGTVYGVWQVTEADLRERGASLVSALRGLAGRQGGAVIVEGCSAELKRQIEVWGEPPGGQSLMRRVKEQLDPRGTLSPGRFAGRI
jgi:glycolate oxidase FAD binding subunit